MNATTKFFDLTATTKVKAFDNDGSLSKTDNDNNFSEAKLRDDFEILSRPPYLSPTRLFATYR